MDGNKSVDWFQIAICSYLLLIVRMYYHEHVPYIIIYI